MSDTNHQTDNRELTEAAIKARILDTREGDRVLFNDRVQPLTVTECPGEEKEWEIDSVPEEFRGERIPQHEVTVTRRARTKDELDFEVGDVVDWQPGPWDPPYEVTNIYPCTCPGCKDLDGYELVLEGPQGGEYLIKNSRKGIRVHNISADRSFRDGFEVYWFQNQGR